LGNFVQIFMKAKGIILRSNAAGKSTAWARYLALDIITGAAPLTELDYSYAALPNAYRILFRILNLPLL